LALFSLTYCSTDIELEGTAEPIPVVYGILDVSDTAHYIRIEKVFQTQGDNAEQLAKDPEVIYYAADALSAVLEKDNGLEAVLERVNGKLEGFVREEGPFATEPNILYKTRSSDFRLDGGEKIRLRLNFSDDTPSVTAETRVLAPVVLSTSSPPESINMGYDRNIRTSWSSGDDVALHALQWIIRYRERRVPGDFEDKTLVWTISDRIEDTPEANLETFTFKGRQFYEFLAAELEASAEIQRQFLGIEIKVISMGAEFEEILRLNNANIGITSTQFEPVYSNINGGIGVFTSRSSARREGIGLISISLDSLKNGIITEDLNF